MMSKILAYPISPAIHRAMESSNSKSSTISSHGVVSPFFGHSHNTIVVVVEVLVVVILITVTYVTVSTNPVFVTVTPMVPCCVGVIESVTIPLASVNAETSAIPAPVAEALAPETFSPEDWLVTVTSRM